MTFDPDTATDSDKLREAARWFDNVDRLLAAITVEDDDGARRLYSDSTPRTEIQEFLLDLANRLER